MLFRPFQLFLRDSTELTLFHTSSALNALGLIYNVSFLNLTCDSVYRAVTCAERASLTLFGIDLVGEELLAYACGTFLVNDVCDIFVAEEVERGENRVGGCLTESAERSGLYVVCELFELVKVFHFTVAGGNLIKDFVKSYSTDTAG